MSEMTADEIRVKCAEVMGLSNVQVGVWYGYKADGNTASVPDYPADLNAMAEAEKLFDGKAHPSAITDERRMFRDELAKIMGVAWYQSATLLRATAMQRAQAFLATVEKIKSATGESK